MSDSFIRAVLTLETAEDTRRAVTDPVTFALWKLHEHPFQYRIRSEFCVALIAEIESTGKYPYNLDVQRLAEKRLGIAEQPDSQSALSVLVYNAQQFRRDDKNVARGLSAFTPEMIAEAGEGGRIELGNGQILNVRRVNGKLYAMPPRARNRCVQPGGHPAKILKRATVAV